jgi:hypothetical protein
VLDASGTGLGVEVDAPPQLNAPLDASSLFLALRLPPAPAKRVRPAWVPPTLASQRHHLRLQLRSPLATAVPNFEHFEPLSSFIDDEVNVTLRLLEQHALRIRSVCRVSDGLA